jgi:hypothetical protein
MNEDRELLALAAKAAGWTGWQSKHGYWNLTSPESEDSTHCHHWNAYCPDTGEKLREPTFADAIAETDWNPITDDGDALRLAVKLGVTIYTNIRTAYVFYGNHPINADEREITATEEPGDDPYAATRRAIVRAAAEIGKVRCASNP